MTGQRGRDLLIKMGDAKTPENFITIAGLRTKTLTLSSERIDITNADSPGAWRELLAAGTRSMQISGSGVFRDQAAHTELTHAFFRQEIRNFQLTIPGNAAHIRGQFLLTELVHTGNYDGELGFSASFASSGTIDFYFFVPPSS